MNTIEVTNEQSDTISSLTAQLEALNAEFLALMQSPPEPGKLPVVQAASITERAAAIIGSRDVLQEKQKTLDTYREKLEANTAGVIQRQKLTQLRDNLRRLSAQISEAMQPLPMNVEDMMHRNFCLDAGIPHETIQELQRQANAQVRAAFIPLEE